MHTLLDFLTRTKEVEYLIAIAFLFGFIAFWMALHYQGTGKAFIVRLLPGIVLMLVTASLAGLRISFSAEQAKSPQHVRSRLLDSAVLVDMYGPAIWNHGLHEKVVKKCTVCHHNSDGTYPPCRKCHGAPFNPKNLRKPGLAHVFHLRCISCHEENRKGPTNCTGCHTKAAVPPLRVGHPLTGGEKCLRCHGKPGIPGVVKIPPNHAGTRDDVCQLCHKLAATALAIRKIPHRIKGRKECLICHGQGIAGAPKVPPDHAGRTNETCLLCHKPKGGKSSHEDHANSK